MLYLLIVSPFINTELFFTYGFGCWQCSEIEELQEKVNLLEQHLASVSGDKLLLSSKEGISEEYVDELRKKVQSQVIYLLLSQILVCKRFISM